MRILALTALLLLPLGLSLEVPLPIKLGQPFTLDANASGTYMARLEAAKLNVEFVRVIQDSRCPYNANCVWAGDAVIELRLSDPRWVKTVQLHTALEPRSVVALGHRIALGNLTKWLGPSVPFKSQATLVLTKP